jgi:hypothetical protein
MGICRVDQVSTVGTKPAQPNHARLDQSGVEIGDEDGVSALHRSSFCSAKAEAGLEWDIVEDRLGECAIQSGSGGERGKSSTRWIGDWAEPRVSYTGWIERVPCIPRIANAVELLTTRSHLNWLHL